MATITKESYPDIEARTQVASIWQAIAIVSTGILFTGMPLAFGGLITYDMFDLPKVVFMRIATLVILAAWGIKIINAGEFQWRKTPLDLPILAFGLASLLSTVFTLSPNLSIHGEYRRYEGFYTIVNYLVLYFLVTNLIRWPQEKKIKSESGESTPELSIPVSQMSTLALLRKLGTSLLSPLSRSLKGDFFDILLTFQILAGVIVALYGIFQHFGKDFVFYNPHGPSPVVSTYGNTNFLAAYLAMVIPIAISLFFQRRSFIGKSMIALCALVMTIGLFYTSSRGAWLGALIAMVFLFWFVGKGVLRRDRRWLIVVAVLLLAPPLANYDFVSSRIQSAFSTGQTSVQFRLQWWRSLVPVIRDNLLLGTGIATLEVSYPKYATLEYARGEGRETFLDKAHNEFIHIAATQGMVGLGTYIWVLAAFGLTLREFRNDKRRKEAYADLSSTEDSDIKYPDQNGLRETREKRWVLLCGLCAGAIAYLVQNQFSFGVIGISSLFWIMMGLAVVIGTPDEMVETFRYRFSLSSNWSFALSLVVAAVMALLVTQAYRPFKADQLYKEAMILSTEGRYDRAIEVFKEVLALNPYQTEYWRGLASTYVDKTRVAESVHGRGDAGTEALLQLAVDAFKRASELNPAPFHYYFLGQTQESFQTTKGLQEAYQNYKKAVALYPYYLYANNALGSAAYQLRLYDESAKAYQTVVLLDPKDVNAYYYLALNYIHLGKDDDQLTAWQRVVELDPNHFAAHFYIATIYDKRGRPDLAKRNYDTFLRIVPKPEDRVEYDRQKLQVEEALKRLR